MSEIWKPIPQDSSLGYVSNYGRIKSARGEIRKLQVSKYGYERVGFKGGSITLIVHRLVAEAFLDNSEDKPCVNHKDCNKRHNHVDNLEWCTHKENVDHAFENKCRGKDFRECLVSNEDYLGAYELRQMGVTNKLLAEHFGVSTGAMCKKLKRIAAVGGVL